jgi:CelD/BcsL family acetyltransferase involved in cellulose biosynthesis
MPNAGMLAVEVLGVDAWAGCKRDWDGLLQQSEADALFLSWDWLDLWWKHFEASSGEELLLLKIRDADQLVGLCAFVVGTVRRRFGVHLRSAQILGNWDSGLRGMYSEYQDVLSLADATRSVRDAVVKALATQLRCDEVVLGCAAAPDCWQQSMHSSGRMYVRGDLDCTSYQADLSAGFDSYAGQLGASTRRSLVNLRSRLKSRGEVAFERAHPDDHAATLDELIQLHRMRWGTPPFSERVHRFHVDLFQRWADADRIHLYRLLVDGQCIAVLYDIRVGSTQYNIQMGFDPSFESKVSLGLLQLGYAMETAAREGVATYDFLAGRGQKADYKKNLSSATKTVGYIQALSPGFSKLLYAFGDGVRNAARKIRSASDRT